jgi:hypothetical protein
VLASQEGLCGMEFNDKKIEVHEECVRAWTLTLILLTSTKWRAPASSSKWQKGFNSAFKGLIYRNSAVYIYLLFFFLLPIHPTTIFPFPLPPFPPTFFPLEVKVTP